MTKSLKTIVEEQRGIAEDLHEWHRNSPEMKETSDAPAMNFQTAIILRYFDDVDRLERLAEVNAPTLPVLASAMRLMVEREIVDSVWLSKGDLVWSLAFGTLHEVDWDELATEFGGRLQERAETLEFVRKSGLLTLIQADDDLPKN